VASWAAKQPCPCSARSTLQGSALVLEQPPYTGGRVAQAYDPASRAAAVASRQKSAPWTPMIEALDRVGDGQPSHR
jgi:hypothetical protein